jgi:Family of unknown function (DUF6600)
MLRKLFVLLLGAVLLGLAGGTSAAGFSLSVGTDDFYMSVGNYDYYPYTLPYYNRIPRISFYDVMSDYGNWVWVPPFGQVWRPYVSVGWRPYTYGHWNYTQYGPTWSGYEPWAWAGYHYGNWIWNPQFGWVWVPGYDWHPGRVIWSQGYNSIGWMPMPPYGYDYSRGYLDYRGSNNQFDYYDDDFGYYDDYYGYPDGYDDLYYAPGYRTIAPNLWVFLDVNHFRYPNYADYYLDSDYTRALFDRRAVRISSRPLERAMLERIVKQKINETPVQVREIEANNRKVKVVIPKGEEENIRRNANRVVEKVIAPAFAEKRRNFKGTESSNAPVLNKVFRQEDRQPKFKKLTAEQAIRDAENLERTSERKRKDFVRQKADEVARNDKNKAARDEKFDRKERDTQFDTKEDNRSKDRDAHFKSNRNANNRRDSDLDRSRTNRNDQFDTRLKKNRNDQFDQPQQKKDRSDEFDLRQKKNQNDEFDTRQRKNRNDEFQNQNSQQRSRDVDFDWHKDDPRANADNDRDREFRAPFERNPRHVEKAPVEQDRSSEEVRKNSDSRKDEAQEKNSKKSNKKKNKGDDEEQDKPNRKHR